MKINDKHLNRIAVGNTPVDKEGYLMKRGEVNRAFQKRWFVLKGNLLFYFDKREEKEATGVIIIEGCTVELAEMTDAFTFELVFPGATSRTYVLAASTQEDMESWMKAITCASYDYMKLMVAELQRQVDDLNEEQKAKANEAAGSSKSNALNLLVDLSEPGTSDSLPPMDPFASPAPKERREDRVAFPNVSGDLKMFDELHQEYGQYILKKMREIGK